MSVHPSENRFLDGTCFSKLNDGAVIRSPSCPAPPLRCRLHQAASALNSLDSPSTFPACAFFLCLPQTHPLPARSAPLRCSPANCRSLRTKYRPPGRTTDAVCVVQFSRQHQYFFHSRGVSAYLFTLQTAFTNPESSRPAMKSCGASSVSTNHPSGTTLFRSPDQSYFSWPTPVPQPVPFFQSFRGAMMLHSSPVVNA